QPLVAAIRRLRGVDDRAVPIEDDRLYQSTRTPSWTWRGSPAPLCTVPSKLKIRLVTSGRWKFLLLNALKTSMAGSTTVPAAHLRGRKHYGRSHEDHQ